MKYYVLFAVLLFVAVSMAQGKPATDIESPKNLEPEQSVEAAPKEHLKGAEAAYLAYSYAAYPYAYSAYPYVVPPPAAVILRR
ncbi:uncharacterized protein LOC142321018 [Lycorma delicatula]|uniref:uncharacterized protein LOC142321018 n=1 Tax=Lycorma delicatula TaxID=130591 RepID=UPI003F51A504